MKEKHETEQKQKQKYIIKNKKLCQKHAINDSLKTDLKQQIRLKHETVNN